MLSRRQNNLTGWILFLVLLACYVYIFPRWADPNQNSRLDMVVAIVEDGTFQIDPYVENTVDYARVGDHYYSDKAPGVAFLGVPIYGGLRLALTPALIEKFSELLSGSDAFQQTLQEDGSGILAQKVRFALAQVLLSFVLAALPSALTGVLIYQVLVHWGIGLWPSLGAALAYGLLTPAFAYAGAYYGHQLSAMLLFASFYLLQTSVTSRGVQRSPRSMPARYFLVGLLLGYSVVTEYPAALVLLVIVAYAILLLMRQGRLADLAWLIVAGMLVAGLWLIYNWQVFGNPFDLGYSHSELWQAQHGTGFMSLTFPRWDAAWGISFSTFRGLFFYSPVLLFSLPGYVRWWKQGKQRAAWWVSLGSIVVMFLFNASSIMWWGGFAIGPRYLLPALPFLALALGYGFQQWRFNWLRKMGMLMFVVWSFVAVWGLTLAGQAFPSDTITNPLLGVALPAWRAGDIARNLGALVDLSGVWSLLPLVLAVGILGSLWYLGMGKVAVAPADRSLVGGVKSSAQSEESAHHAG